MAANIIMMVMGTRRAITVAEIMRRIIMSENEKCCICKKKIEQKHSHNAGPYKYGVCCEKCNYEIVVPFRTLLRG